MEWNQVALTYPDGAVRNPTRPPGDSPTLSVAPGDTHTSPIVFAHNLDDPYSGTFLPGGYAVHYDGTVAVGTFFCQGTNCRIDSIPENGRGFASNPAH